MKINLLVVCLSLLALMMVGCARSEPAQELAPGAPGGAIEPSEVPEEAEPLVEMAKADLAAERKVNTEDIVLLDVEQKDFSDASLGVPDPDKMYAQMITPGYVIQLGVGDTVYTYHGSGDRVVRVPED